jgi:hypothetical protein
METATTVKRPRGRPRLDAPPRAAVNVRLRPEVRAQLERDAKRATRSVTKEISVRIEKSYVRDEMFGGPQMASMFREMASVALGVARQKNRGPFFENFETFVLVRDIWQRIIQSQMPRPADELLAEIGRNWDAVKAGALQTPAQQAAREWLLLHTPMTMTLAEALAGTVEPGISSHGRTRESVSDKPAETNESSVAGGAATPSNPIDSIGLSARAAWPIGSLAKVMEGLIPSQGNARAAAQEVSRLAQLLAEMTEGEAADDTAVPRVEPDDNIAAARGE